MPSAFRIVGLQLPYINPAAELGPVLALLVQVITWRVCDTRQVVEVALLLQNECLGLPLPNQKLKKNYF
jgi:hypothetical protein